VPIDSRLSEKLSKKSGVALRFPPHSKKRGAIASGEISSDLLPARTVFSTGTWELAQS